MAFFVRSCRTGASRKLRADGSHTELFLWPLLQCKDSRSSLKVARCERKAKGLEKQINDVCSTLNAMLFDRAGRHLLRCHPTRKGAASPAQMQVRPHVGRLIRLQWSPPAVSDLAGALSELFKNTDVYNLDRECPGRP